MGQLLKNAGQDSGNHEDGIDGTNSADGKISSAGKPEVVRRRSGRVSKPPERFQNMTMLSVEDPLTYEEAISSPEKEKWKAALNAELESIKFKKT